MTHTKNHSHTHGYPTPKRQPPVTYSPPSNFNFNSPQGRISPPPLGWRCPVYCLGGTQTNESEGYGEKEAEPYSRPAHFPSWVAGSRDIIHQPDYTPNHQRSQIGTLHQRVVGISMRNDTRHDPCIPRHWAMGCPAWTLAEPSHNKVV